MARHSMVTGSILRDPVNPDLLRQYLGGLKEIDTAGEEQITGLRQRVGEHSNISAQNLLARLQSEKIMDPTTGLEDPMATAAKRQQMVDQRSPWDLTNMEKINLAMPKMEKEGKAKFQTDLDVTSKLRSEGHKAIGREQALDLNQFRPGTDLYKTKLEEIEQYNLQNSINVPEHTAAYKNLFERENFTLSPDTIIQGVGTDSLDLGGNVLIKENFTPKNYEKTIQIAEANIRKRFPLLRDETVIRSRAKALVDNSKYGPEFARQAGYSMVDKEINTLASNLGTAIDKGDSVGKFKAANAMMSYMRINKVSPDDKIRFNADIMQVVRTMDIFPGSGKGGGFGEARLLFNSMFGDVTETGSSKQAAILIDRGNVPSGIQAKFKDLLREVYRGRLPGMTDEILTQQMGVILNNDSDLSTAFVGGQKTAAGRSRTRDMQQTAVIDAKTVQTKLLIRINKSPDRGVKNIISNDILADWREKGYLGKDDAATETKLRRQVDLLTDRLDSFFRGPDGKTLLTREGKNAYKLTVTRMLKNNVGLDKDRMWRWFGDRDDIVLTRPTADMSGDDFNAIMELFRKNMPDPKYSVQSTTKDGFKIKDGAAQLLKVMEEKQKEVASLPDDVNLYNDSIFFSKGARDTWIGKLIAGAVSVFMDPKNMPGGQKPALP